jgi:choline dehydrogenase-like flavoprotein
VEEAFKAKSEARFPDRRVTIGRAAHLTAPTEEQIALGRGKCQHRNMCMRGCPFGAYFSSNSATLVAAERTGNLKIRPASIVTSLIFNEKKGKAEGVKVLDATTGEEIEFYADVVFLCASTLNSTWVMLNSTSKRFPNGFGNASDQLGRNLMDHHLGVGAQADAPGFEEMYYSGRRPNGIYVPRFRNLGDAASKRADYIRGFGYQGGASRPTWSRSLHGLRRRTQGRADPARTLDDPPGGLRRDPSLYGQSRDHEPRGEGQARLADADPGRLDPRKRAGHAQGYAGRGGGDADRGGLQERGALRLWLFAR